jgi:protein SCO1
VRLSFTLVVGLLLLGGCSGGQEHELHGQVLAVDRGRQELTIKHGDIRGFMPGMTMPFKVKDARLLDGRSPGELVTATLVVNGNAAYLTKVTATGRAPLSEPAPSARPLNILEPGTPVPDIRLTDESGTPRSLSDWRGRVLAVTFTYTRCPLPDFCPRMDRNFAAAQRALLADPGLRDKTMLLSVSIDPAFDTPQVLAEHATRAGADARVWRYLTGERDAIESFASRFGVSVFREGADPAALTHNLRTAIIRPDGTLATVLGGTDWTAAALLEAVRQARE